MQKMQREESAGYLVNWAARLFIREIEGHLLPLGLSSGHIPVFFALAGDAPKTQKDLARYAAVEQPTMAATLARMERDGLVERTPNPVDGRSALIALSAKGRGLERRVFEAAAAVNAAALGGLSERERTQFLRFMRRIVSALDSQQ